MHALPSEWKMLVLDFWKLGEWVACALPFTRP
jgi:hypothetical protein